MPFKKCFVSTCSNTSENCENKLFILIPSNKTIRTRWFSAVNKPFTTTKIMYCCEDHFDLEVDMENWMHFKLLGSRVFMKKEVVPHKFITEKKPHSYPSSQLPLSSFKRRLEIKKNMNKAKSKVCLNISAPFSETPSKSYHSPILRSRLQCSEEKSPCIFMNEAEPKQHPEEVSFPECHIQVGVKLEKEPSIIKIEPTIDLEIDNETSTIDNQEVTSFNIGCELNQTITQTAPREGFCRLCLRLANIEEMIPLTNRSKKYIQMIKYLMPNFDINLVHNPIMCHLCTTQLELACQFVDNTMETQKTIEAYRNDHTVNDQKVFCEDVVNYKNRLTDLDPLNKKLFDKTTNPDYYHQPFHEEDSQQIEDEHNVKNYEEELKNVLSDPLDDKIDEVKTEIFNSNDFGQFESVILENSKNSYGKITIIKSEPLDEDFDGSNSFSLLSNQNLKVKNISDMVSEKRSQNFERCSLLFHNSENS